jgi:DTW domain-containing protein YfiP
MPMLVQALVSAHPEHEDELSSLVKSRPPGTVCMLYPSEDALPADEWLKGISAGQVATVVLVDATWDQVGQESRVKN